jgi:predicted nucleic acid-binding protein
MAPLYFVDTWYLIARYDRFDDQHADACTIERRLSSAVLFTHDAILTEFLAFVAAYGTHHRREAVRFMREFMQRAIVLPADRQLLLIAVDLYENRPDKAYSLVDCMSMLVMRAHGITHVLTNDHHFTQERFSVVTS